MKILIIVLCVITIGLLLACSNKAPDTLGLKNGLLAPCPESPNCVSSQATDSKHSIQPIMRHGTPEVVMVDLANAIESMFGAKVTSVDGTYLRAEFTSRLLRFVDDVEFYYDQPNGLIQVRSASRVGYSDFNTNRERVEKIREILIKRK